MRWRPRPCRDLALTVLSALSFVACPLAGAHSAALHSLRGAVDGEGREYGKSEATSLVTASRSLLQSDIQCTGYASGTTQACPTDRPAAKCCTPGEGGTCEDSAQVVTADGRCPSTMSEFDCCTTSSVSPSSQHGGPSGASGQTELACRDQSFGSSCPSDAYTAFCCDNATNRCRGYNAAVMGPTCPSDRPQYSCCLAGPTRPPAVPSGNNGDLTCAAAVANSTCPALTPLRYCCDAARGLCHELAGKGGVCPTQRPQYSCCSTVTPLAPPAVSGSTSPSEQRGTCTPSSGGPRQCQAPLTGTCCSSASAQGTCTIFRGAADATACPAAYSVAMCCSQNSTLGLSQDSGLQGGGLSWSPSQAPGQAPSGATMRSQPLSTLPAPAGAMNRTSGEGAWTCAPIGTPTTDPFKLCNLRGLPEPKCCDGSTNLCLDYLAASFGTSCPAAMPLRCCKFNFRRRQRSLL